MNSKLMKAGIAGAAVVALAAGGGTYAAYSDFGNITGNSAGAGTLTLNLGNNAGGDLKYDHVFMAPGDVGAARTVYVASNDGTAATKSKLFLSLQDLVGTEDGCDGNAEVIDDANCVNTAAAIAAGTATGPLSHGQFINDALLTVTSYIPDPTTHKCNPSNASKTTDVTPEVTKSLSAWAASAPYELTGDRTAFGGPDVSTLAQNQGICVSMQIGLPFSANNESQGDQAAFTTHFDLNQVAS